MKIGSIAALAALLTASHAVAQSQGRLPTGLENVASCDSAAGVYVNFYKNASLPDDAFTGILRATVVMSDGVEAFRYPFKAERVGRELVIAIDANRDGRFGSPDVDPRIVFDEDDVFVGGAKLEGIYVTPCLLDAGFKKRFFAK